MGGDDAHGEHAMNIEVLADRDILFKAADADNLGGTGQFGVNSYVRTSNDNSGLDRGAANGGTGANGNGRIDLRNQRIVPGTLTF